MDCGRITREYYSRWLGREGVMSSEDRGILFIETAERDIVQRGYSKRFDIFALIESERAIISYGERARAEIGNLKRRLGTEYSVEAVKVVLEAVYEKPVHHGIKFLYTNSVVPSSRARVLEAADFSSYARFFAEMNPGCDGRGWLYEYFTEMTEAGLCCGVFEDGRLVSCTDAPSMPYMAERVQEIGVNTLREFRGRGYASDAASLCASNIVKSGKCPMWSCSADNAASARLALRVGFVKLADSLALTQ